MPGEAARPMLPGPRLFRSRWAALLWAGGIVWAAADLADALPHRDPPPRLAATPPATPDTDVATLVAALH